MLQSLGQTREVHIYTHTKNPQDGTSLVVQSLVLCPSSARGASLIPGVGSKISHAAQPKIN